MRKLLAGIGVAALALGGTAGCEPAEGCGTVLTRNTTLTDDVVGCAGDALVVGADHIVIDLAGHTVGSDDGVGLRIAGHRGVRVRNGTIEGRGAGLAAVDSSRLAIDDVTVRGVDVGLQLERVTHSTARRTTAHGLTGISLVDAHRNRLQGADAPGAGPDSGHGIRLSGSDRNRISGGRYSGGNDSMSLFDSHLNVLLDNDASNSNTVGIHLQRSDGNVLRGNVAGSEVGAIEVIDSSDTVVQDTALSRWHGGGEPEGVLVRGSTRTSLVRNSLGDVVVIGSTRTEVRDNHVDRIHVTSSDGVDVDGNRVVASTAGWSEPEHGIFVPAGSTDVIVLDNDVSGFLVDGISVGAAGTVVRRNTSNDNGNLGIWAVPDVVDGGGNRASGNGNPLQCVNVTCS